jgi:UDP-N-acetylglucosamine:LPS N-acetylglucosamine transferase|tara:strand:+ start:328 stop:771 length:444 start_codon:yes stop_codon:yes gene_type:complete
MKKILVIASAGGHWKELMLLRPAFESQNVKYVTTMAGLPEQNGITNYSLVCDSNKDKKLRTIYSFIQMIGVFTRFWPDVVITTGAAPGLLGLVLGKLFFKKTIWIDSVANAEELSLSGKISRKFADVVLTQWEQLADEKVQYKGSVF